MNRPKPSNFKKRDQLCKMVKNREIKTTMKSILKCFFKLQYVFSQKKKKKLQYVLDQLYYF